jgi:acyl carrier protein phosphodiesterase
MNFLAHIYLSGKKPGVKLGNFIGDWVKGKSYTEFPSDIQTGVLMHRDIDTYTDKHPVIKKSAARVKDIYNRYAGIVIDILYDHLLAAHWDSFSRIPLQRFASGFYAILLSHYYILPKTVKDITFKLILSNRLVTYRKKEGLRNALSVMAGYTSLPDRGDQMLQHLDEQYHLYVEEFYTFFAEIMKYIEQKYEVELPELKSKTENRDAGY